MENWFAKRSAAVFGFALSLGACAQKKDSDSGLSDDMLKNQCYAAVEEVGDSSRHQWIHSISRAAQNAEAKWGTPAAAILAMSANEGGYGKTRTAIHAFNPFGYKWTSAEAAGGRGYYVLECQPPEDENNKYIKFNGFADAVNFVAMKLATLDREWSNYKRVTDDYINSRRSGGDLKVAVDRWIEGISHAGYNYDPPTYIRTITQHAHNFIRPSWQLSQEHNTYQFSYPVQPQGAVVDHEVIEEGPVGEESDLEEPVPEEVVEEPVLEP